MKNINKYHIQKPAITIVMPVYNMELFVGDAIESILNQTFTDFEFVIIDDGSTDNTWDIIKSYKDERIVLLQTPQNIGNYPSRNKGMQIAQGKYIAVMDGDDIALPDRLNIQYHHMEEHIDVLACGSAYQILNTEMIVVRPTEYELIKYNLVGFFCMLHPTLFFRRETVPKLLFYDENYRYSADYELICRLALIGPVVNLRNLLLKHREHEKQISTFHFYEQDQNARAIQLNYQQKLGFIISAPDFLDQLALYIESISIYANAGLFYGKMGMVLFLFMYAKNTHNPKSEERAFELLLSIQKMIHKETSINISNGLSGIGLGILYLLVHGFIEGNPDEILEEIDRKIVNETFQNMDMTFDTGLIGIICYVLYRLESRKRKEEHVIFNSIYLDKLLDISEHLLKSVKGLRYEFIIINYIHYKKGFLYTLDWDELLKKMIEPLPIDKSIANWFLGLKSGCAGMGMYKMKYFVCES